MLKIYNTLTQQKEDFVPKSGKKVNLFVCGPTVYDSAHIGHARTYIAFDMIAKYLKEKGFSVFYLQNITDIDDKIINRAKENNISPNDLAKNIEKKFMKDMKSLKIDSVKKYAKATDHIKEIINQVGRLMKNGYAYKTDDGIYYDISQFSGYGKLSRRTVEQAEDGVSRIDSSETKKNKGDFCLWKFSKGGEPTWDFKTGKYLGMAVPTFAKASAGRPGWHIEDTAITEKYFGAQYDIHGGAIDLIFPHHEAEIAQMEAISGKSPLVKYWMHTGFLTINGQKMAKSLGNFITVQDFIKNNSARLLRYFIIKNYYHSPIDYSERVIIDSQKELEKIDEFTEKLKKQKAKTNSNFEIKPFETKLAEAMDDDFNTPKAMAVIFELVNKGNSLMAEEKMNAKIAKDILNFLKKIDGFFGFIFWETKQVKIPEQVKQLVQERETARKNQEWQKSDELREKIKELGWQIEDTKDRTIIKKL